MKKFYPFDKLSGKRLVWTDYIKIFCDGGHVKYRIIPHVVRAGYDKYWKMYGFRIYWLGREFNFTFGKDINKLYID